MARIWTVIAVVLLAILLPSAGNAHLTPNSEVKIDFGDDQIVADIIIPQGEYAVATGNRVDNSRQSRANALRFLQSHIQILAPNRAKWDLVFDQISFVQIAGPPDLHAILIARPPTGQSARRFTIEWSAVIDRVPNHSALFVVRQDFGSGKEANRREILGAVQGAQQTVKIDRGESNAFAGFLSAMRLGMHHIAIGHDHLLFLIALLIPVPLVARNRRWQSHVRSAKDCVWMVVKIVTAFTIGHSITLIAAAFLGLQLSAQPVEILIAISILITALHAFRPLFASREPIVAAAFGLVHGLAFATIIGEYGLGTGEKILTILGFNIGIELVQLLVVLAASPALLMLAQHKYYPFIRNGLAAFTGIAALAWLAERALDVPNIVAETIGILLAYSPWLIIGFSVFAVGQYAIQRGRNVPI